ncbi:MAG: hypothetical protein DI556_04795 [Rhodovulum sulfidophilum]|uniref:Uncharacterized protein n=1 Tax=Rhodovulum sulfidophilum TaxID=35806 RepID=A0A2W5ND87_RHOSU|nr:MAG: hypothetical protein DI556_04795 [Rhodovulum sulfidophilum]
MKNPWMSAWLSAANKAAGPMRGAWMAEAERRRRAFLDQWMKSMTAGLAATRPKPAPKRRPKKK